MKTISITFLVFIGFVAIQWNAVHAGDDGSFEEDGYNQWKYQSSGGFPGPLQYDCSQDRSKALNFLRRTLFHPTRTKCEEQKREAKEDYEERCEPSNPIYRNQGTKRNCPDLDTWEAFKNYEINDGLGSLDDYKPNIKLPKLPRIPSANEVGNRVYDRVTD